MSDFFRFKQFTVQQDATPMKVGTDGVLLGAWTMVEDVHQILDIGTGTGLIALMAAQRNPLAQIDAIEIEEVAYRQAQENVANSPWNNRISPIHCSLFDFHPDKLYDCIICNPPFFNGSTKTPDSGRTTARHSDRLPHRELAMYVSRLLKPEGSFNVVLPVPEAEGLIAHARASGLFPERITYVRPTPHKPPKRCLIRFSFQMQAVKREYLVVELERHKYSDDYIRLTRDFYLNL